MIIKRLLSLSLPLLSLFFLTPDSRAEETKPVSASEGVGGTAETVEAEEAVSLQQNSGMEADGDGDNWPDHWTKHKDATWEEEDGNRFLRLRSPEPGATVLLYQKLPLPGGVEALEMKWRQRASDLTPGREAWFDARIMLEFRNAEDQKIEGAPGAPYLRRATDGWQERSLEVLIPEGATSFVLMPALFQVEKGVFDLDDLTVTAIDAGPVRERAAVKAAERAQKLAAEAESRGAKAAALLETEGSLVSNGNFEAEAKGGGWPNHWGGPKSGLSWENEEGNRFLRLNASEPGEVVMVYRTFDVPVGTRALEMSWRQRVSGLKSGSEPWYDARIMLDCLDASRKKLPKQPSAPYSRRNTEGWEEKTKSFLVPEGTVTVALMPSLFRVKSGTFDLDDIRIKPTDPEVLLAEMKKAAEAAEAAKVPPEEPKKDRWPKEIKVSGNRLVDPEGKEVWLQGVNVPSLEWSVQGESVLRSVLTAIDGWKANVIRLPVKDEYWFGQKGQKDGGKAYRELVDQVVTLAANRGAYVVLDLHRYRAPRKEYLDFWTDAATRYKDHPAVLFDLINEPHGVSWEVWRNGGFVEEKKKEGDEDAFLTEDEKKHNKRGFVSPGMQAMVDTVRATGAKNVVVAGGLDYAYQLDGIVNGFALEDKTGNGIMYACHIYPWKSDWQKYLLDAAALHPILLGEVGADVNKMTFMPLEQQEDAHTWVPDMLGLIQKHRLNWTGWAFHPKASPRMLLDWDYTPTPVWGQPAKEALSGKQFPLEKLR